MAEPASTDERTTERVFTLSAAERELLPSAEDVRFYQEHGWYLSRRLFTDAEIGVLREASDRFYAGHRDRRLPMHPPSLAYWTPERGETSRMNDYIHYEVDAIRAILTKPLIGAVAAALAGVDVIRLFQSTLLYKPPVPDEQTNRVGWHFDRTYWSTSSSERMLTAFIPMHDCDEEIGGIRMADGSHRWRHLGADDSGTLHFAALEPDNLEERLRRNAAYNEVELRPIPMVIPVGQMSFHHCLTYHSSAHNRTGRPRRAISLHLQDGDNHWRPYRLQDGSLLRYNHDYLVRSGPAGEPDYSDPDFCPVIWKGPVR